MDDRKQSLSAVALWRGRQHVYVSPRLKEPVKMSDDTLSQPQKTCSICGISFPLAEFTYGNRENRSYCSSCDKLEKQAYSQGGAEAARKFREMMRDKWKR